MKKIKFDQIVGMHPALPHPCGAHLAANDSTTTHSVPHRLLNSIPAKFSQFIAAMGQWIADHHISAAAIARDKLRREALARQGFTDPTQRLPINTNTQKGNWAESVSELRRALLDPETLSKLSAIISETTLEWLHLLVEEHGAPIFSTPKCARFTVDVPAEINTLHVRRSISTAQTYLCSIDAKFKVAVESNKDLPFDKFADDSRFSFIRDGEAWIQQCRDPRL